MRLIDADALLAKKGEAWDADGNLLYVVGTGNIMAAPTVNEWISVKDRLPEPGSPALVYGSAGAMTVARYTAGNIWLVPGIFSAVTHWMPLPEPPKEVKCDEVD